MRGVLVIALLVLLTYAQAMYSIFEPRRDASGWAGVYVVSFVLILLVLRRMRWWLLLIAPAIVGIGGLVFVPLAIALIIAAGRSVGTDVAILMTSPWSGAIILFVLGVVAIAQRSDQTAQRAKIIPAPQSATLVAPIAAPVPTTANTACPWCGTTNPSGSTYCGRCGAAIGPVCPHCSAARGSETRFCRACGASFAPAISVAHPDPASPAADLRHSEV